MAAEEPAGAAPLRAVDWWRASVDGDALTITARVAVRGDDPNLRGHFPGLAVYPGIFVIETLCQAMACALGGTPPPELRGIRSVRFLAPLLDGDELTLEIAGTRPPDGGWDVVATGLRSDGTK
ncbi:MAG: 3-hydroxyacyl-ACP dehydratase FabZ family protein, partial [Pseudonocardiaceae bacterium]